LRGASNNHGAMPAIATNSPEAIARAVTHALEPRTVIALR
jgi:hypothetical protein